ncbi:MAG: DNA polymerase III subunit chi [Mesorhizobium sp.]|nr:MAG: DNA polymerase III subunit chi [Mesorhizobium sp.]
MDDRPWMASPRHVLKSVLDLYEQRGWRAVVQTGTEERRDALDQHLWTFRDDSFLAHATDREAYPAEQPVLLTTGEGNQNAAQIRFLVDGASPPELSGYERAVFLFDGHDAAQLEAARGHWKTMKEAGHAVTYWQQTPDRRWERKA